MIGTNKLTTEKVEDIRQMISAGMNDQSIADIFNVSRSNINLIRNKFITIDMLITLKDILIKKNQIYVQNFINLKGSLAF